MPDEQPNKTVTLTLPSGQIASKLVDVLVRDQPLGWSRKSYSAYYNLHYANWLKPVLDDMIARRVSKVFLLENFNIKLDSLYLRINHSFRFICDHLDSENVYKSFYDEIEICKLRRRGATIKFKERLDMPSGEDFVDKKDAPKWRQKLDEYIDAPATGAPLYIKNLLLDEDEIEQIKLELEGLSNLVYSVDCREIKVIKSL